MQNRIIIPQKTDEDIIAAVNAKSHITASCFGFDEGTGAVLSDKFGNLDDITLNGAPSWNSGASGEPDGFIECDATTTTAYYNTPGTEAPKATHTAQFKTSDIGSGSLIHNIWINSPGIDPSSQEFVFSFGDSTTGDGWYALLQDATSITLRHHPVDGTTEDDIDILNTSLSNDTWHMVSVVMDSDSIDLYLDGASTPIDSLASPVLTIDPANNTNTDRGLHLFCNGVGGGSTFLPGSSTRTVYFAKLMSIKSTTSLSSSYASLIASLYRAGPGRLAPALIDL